jgi:signal transduction histidine kinase
VVESHGGSVTVQSELGAGSTFTARLPVLDEQTRADH